MITKPPRFNYKGQDSYEIINQYIYLINKVFIGKEVVVQYYGDETEYKLWMGMNNRDIDLPKDETHELLFNTELFALESGSRNQETYVLKDLSELKKWCQHKVNDFLLNSIDVEKFKPVIQQLNRINNLDKLLYNQ